MARTARRYEKRTEKKSYQIPVYMAAIYARLSVDTDERKSESIETQVTLIKEFIDGTMRKQIKSMNWLYMIFIPTWEKPELILRELDLNE